MDDIKDDISLTDEERALAERGRSLVAAAMAHPDAQAPPALRESLAAAGPAPRRRSRLARSWVLAPGLAVVAAGIVALVVALGGSGSDRGPSAMQVAAVARLPASAPAPAAIGGSPPRLAARVGTLAFPDYGASYGLRASGRRSDRVGGRAVTTVAYRYRGQTTIAYAIVAGAPIRWGPGRDITRGGHRYRLSASPGRRTVTWTQDGHTCVIDAPSTVSTAQLMRLATWT